MKSQWLPNYINGPDQAWRNTADPEGAASLKRRYGRLEEIRRTEEAHQGICGAGNGDNHLQPRPDAQDRLRRLFSLLVKYASKDKLPPTESDPPSEDANEVDD